MKNSSENIENQTSSPSERARVKLKVCGMNHNPEAVAQLQPDYLGFIFWEPSSRFFNGKMPTLDPSIKKVGVFVDAPLENVLKKIKEFDLSAVQLHGKETPEYCDALRHDKLVSASHENHVRSGRMETSDLSTPLKETKVQIIKVFSIKNAFDFSILEAYEDVCDYYLFDTKGKLPGGNGYTFNWSVLENYPSTKPYFLSGGIGLENTDDVLSFLLKPESKYCHAIDINSKFEIEPGLKNIEQLKEFKNKITSPL